MGKRVLVAYATKTGSTAEIAEAIGAEMGRAGLDVVVRPVAEVADLDPYGTVVLGSSLYAGRWRREAVRFLRRNAEALRERRVWLFHSGPLGEEHRDEPQKAPPKVLQLAERIGTDAPVTFGGRLEPATAQGFIARKMAEGEMAGDFRDWDEIRAWARDVAGQIAAKTA